MNLIVVPNKVNVTTYLKHNIKSFIFGLKDFSVNYEEISLDELKELLEHNPDINIYLAINKMIFNQDLEKLKDLLLKLDKLNIAGIMFYDLSILSIKKDLALKINLIWHQTHFVTNYNTCNYFYDEGAHLGVLSSEITLEEMIEINSKTKMELLVYVFGHSIISHGRRKLLSNHHTYNNKSEKSSYHLIKDRYKGDEFIVYEDEKGISICTNKVLNGSKALLELMNNNFTNFILDQHLIDDKTFLQIISLYQQLIDKNSKNKEPILDKVENLIGNYTGFFYQKTIYKVKI